MLEPMNAGDKGEHAYRYYMYDSSCGKFMNTLFLLALRKARSLETFKWVLLPRERRYVLTFSADGISEWNSVGRSSKPYIKFELSRIYIFACKRGTPCTKHHHHRIPFNMATVLQSSCFRLLLWDHLVWGHLHPASAHLRTILLRCPSHTPRAAQMYIPQASNTELKSNKRPQKLYCQRSKRPLLPSPGSRILKHYRY